MLFAAPVNAARPLLDRHQWDAYFALFARDVMVPWKPATVRLDTYSGAPVDFAAYNVDPADVVLAGPNRGARPIDTSHLRPLVRWRFSPPPGYRFESSDVPVPLGSQEGFYVIEARRGDAVQQVWLNRTHVGLVTQESAGGVALWSVDLRSGRPLGNVKVSYLVGTRLVDTRTDRNGFSVWHGSSRPTFALVEDGAGRGFVSLLPQSPLPVAIVGLRVESAVARAGERVRFVGFARKRGPSGFRPATGDARITLFGRGTTLGSTPVHLDAAGAFTGDIAVPAGVDAGDYSLLASAAGGVGGTTVHVDAAGDVVLGVRSACPCDAALDVPFSIVARRGTDPASDVLVHVLVVRTPHVVPPGATEDEPRFGTTVVYERTLHTDATGVARGSLSAPSDGLDSTYAIRATTRGASASGRIVVPIAKVSLAIEPEQTTLDVGEPAAFDVRAFDSLGGADVPGATVKVALSHGASSQEQTLVLDARGRGHVVFAHANLGTNLAIAQTRDGSSTVLDAAAVVVQPSALAGPTAVGASDVSVALDKARYRPGDRANVRASAPGATGTAFVALDGAASYQMRTTRLSSGVASATLDLGDAQGALKASVAVVRDSAIEFGSADVHVDGAGRDRELTVELDKSAYAASEIAHVRLFDGGGDGDADATVAVRIADGRASEPALFEDAPAVLDVGATSAQAPASADPQWHAYVAPIHSKASDIFAAERPRKPPPELPTIGVATPRTLYWNVARQKGAAIDVPVPTERGHYVLSVLKISDDGDVGAATATFNVQ